MRKGSVLSGSAGVVSGDRAVLSLRALQRVEEVRQAADGDGRETGIKGSFACGPDRSNSPHLRLQDEESGRERREIGEKKNDAPANSGIP